MAKHHSSRRSFLKRSGTLATIAAAPHAAFAIHQRPTFVGEVVGQGDFTYRVDKHWGIQDPGKIPVRHCHEMVQDRKGRLIMSTTHTRNNVIIYDQTGRALDTWGTTYPGAHGLTISQEGEEEFLFLTDTERHQVYKLTLDGRLLLTIDYPREAEIYSGKKSFLPTEVAIGPQGDIYVADGYGENWIIQYDRQGRYVRHFGGKEEGPSRLDCCHGITLDTRGSGPPTLLVTSRSAQEFKRFSLDGQHLQTVPVPGCWICRPVIKGDHLYFAVIGTKSWWEYDGLLLIMDQHNQVVAAPGALETSFKGLGLQSITYDGRTFMNPHDVCVDQDDNLYVPQWYSGNTYPVKLSRI